MAAPAKKTVAVGIGGAAAAILMAVTAVEGGYVNNKDDPGGVTNHGITEEVARAHGFEGDMHGLSLQLAQSILYQDYIVKPGYAPLLDVSPGVVEELVDSAVNTGPSHPSRWFQLALNSLSRQGRDYPQVPVDGQVGDQTVFAYRQLEKVRGKVSACRLMLKALDGQQTSYYIDISIKSPRLQTFTAGWLANRIGNVPLSHCG